VLALESSIFGLAYIVQIKDKFILEKIDVFKGRFWEPEDEDERARIVNSFEH
jgi:hypothetical protein